MDEFSKIKHWNTNQQNAVWKQEMGVLVDIGDDAAVTHHEDLRQEYQISTMDTMVEQIHFNWSTINEYQLGYKALASNLSDLAAMGGTPLYALISVSVPPYLQDDQTKRMYDGIYACANTYKIAIIGGDTTSSPEQLSITIAAIGKTNQRQLLLRSSAKPGDVVFITGAAGLSAAGLDYLLNPKQAGFSKRLADKLCLAHQMPRPHLQEGKLLAESKCCHALNDVSDGIASEAHEIAKASLVDIVLDEEKIPLPESITQYAAMVKKNAMDWVLYGGEDYILIGTMPAEKFHSLKASFHEQGLELYMIGSVETGTGQVWLEQKNYSSTKKKRMAIEAKGFNHFR